MKLIKYIHISLSDAVELNFIFYFGQKNKLKKCEMYLDSNCRFMFEQIFISSIN